MNTPTIAHLIGCILFSVGILTLLANIAAMAYGCVTARTDWPVKFVDRTFSYGLTTGIIGMILILI